MSQSLAYLNGRLLPADQAALALNDAGFVMGATVTDLCRTVRHQLYRWEDHLARWRQSCQAAQIHPPYSETELSRVARDLVACNAGLLPAGDDLALVVFATPGAIGYYAGADSGAGDAQPTVGMHTFRLPFARYRRLFSQGAHLAVPATRQVPASSVDPRIKQRSRMHWWLADREIHTAFPGAWAVLLDEHGHLTETASANLLLVLGGAVHTPPTGAALDGISLRVVRELCGELGIGFVQRPLTVRDALNAEEILLTSTPWCLCGVSRFDAISVPWPGPMWQRLLQLWSERIGLDIRKQIEGQEL
jgi:branched-chain amino acid aminotransferase